MRTFRLNRRVDHSGVSGNGYVAEGWETSYGEVFLRWYGTGFSFFNSMDDMLAVHGHKGDTIPEFICDDNVRLSIKKG